MYIKTMLDGRKKIFSSEKAYEELVTLETMEVQPLEVAGCIEDEFWEDVFRSFAEAKLETASFNEKDIETYIV